MGNVLFWGSFGCRYSPDFRVHQDPEAEMKWRKLTIFEGDDVGPKWADSSFALLKLNGVKKIPIDP